MEEKNRQKEGVFIEGGAVIWARKTIESEIFREKPDKWFKIWFFIISQANYQDNKQFSRGSNYFTYSQISYFTGSTRNQIESALKWLRETAMISSSKTTRGSIISVVKYDDYQDLANYSKTYNLHRTQNQPTVIGKMNLCRPGLDKQEVINIKEEREGDVQISENLHNTDTLGKVVEDKQEAATESVLETKNSAPKKVLPKSAIPFEDFWAIWPNKKAKAPAQTAWEVLTVTTQRVIMNDIPMRSKCSDWTKDGGRFIPLPTTYIHQERWNDEIIEYKQDRPKMKLSTALEVPKGKYEAMTGELINNLKLNENTNK